MSRHEITFNVEALRERIPPRGAAALARSIGITKGTMSKYLNGTKSPSLRTAVALARVLDLSVEQLVSSG
jgi:transcriptional regulator with XRE-family HTH domain